MKLLPYKKVVFESELDGSQLALRLNEYITPYKWYDDFKDSPKQYFGKIRDGNFRILRIIKKGRNSFIPIVNGRIESHQTGSKILVTIRLHFSVILFLAFIIILAIYSAIKHHGTEGFLFILFSYLIIMHFFNDECNKTTNDLRTILKSGIEQS